MLFCSSCAILFVVHSSVHYLVVPLSYTLQALRHLYPLPLWFAITITQCYISTYIVSFVIRPLPLWFVLESNSNEYKLIFLFVYYNTTALFDSYILRCFILIINRCPPYIKTTNYPNLQRTEIDLQIVF